MNQPGYDPDAMTMPLPDSEQRTDAPPGSGADLSKVGAVAIGRNEGERLKACLESLVSAGLAQVVYVDSGSTDGSRSLATSLGVDVVELDLRFAFTAARARNAGFERLMELRDDVEFVQFVDGDCAVRDGWLAAAAAALRADKELAGVTGRRRERYPDKSVYNLVCDMEWDAPASDDAGWFGGDAMVRVKALKQAEGYNPRVIAGEEPELCIRLRRDGWRIAILPREMTWHDAAMTRFGQWWKRSVRAGHAYRELATIHRSPDHTPFAREALRPWLWLLGPPVAVAVATTVLAFVSPWLASLGSLMLLGVYALLILKSAKWRLSRGDEMKQAVIWGVACTVGKLPEAVGQCVYWWNRWRGRDTTLIEYKGPPAPGRAPGSPPGSAPGNAGDQDPGNATTDKPAE
ncbi:MAG: glycosyltransferase family 2 protein [Planctomycetota bacterium]